MCRWRLEKFKRVDFDLQVCLVTISLGNALSQHDRPFNLPHDSSKHLKFKY